MQFPADFLWGTATASVQIEGAARADGKGESIWDRFARLGNVAGGWDVIDQACDHYERWPEDLDIMAEMGLTSYRFSIAWPRICPEGRGPLNQKGLDFYRRIVAGLRERGIQPAATLYHWDLPQALQQRGGWLNRETSDRFAEYADALFGTIGSDVPIWMTLNEPFISTFMGHITGEHAPGLKRPLAAMQAAHHLLLAHGKAVQAFRAAALPGARIGLANFLWVQDPASEKPADLAAAWRADGMINRWFLDPVLRGRYPEDIWRWFRSRFAAPTVGARDLEIISQPIDFLGVQYYSRVLHRANPWNLFTGFAQVDPKGVPVTDMGWEYYPEGLDRLLVRLHADYPGVPLIVTENGAAYQDHLRADGTVADPDRVRYLQDHIGAVGRAMAAGVPVQGYYVWSLMDNVEWHHGVNKRFGLIYIDFETQRRHWKESARWYERFIKGGAVLAEEAERDEPA